MDYLELDEDRNIHLIHNYEYYYPNSNPFIVSNKIKYDFFVYSFRAYQTSGLSF